MKLSPIEAGKRFIVKHYDDCETALLCGSVVRGDYTQNSDLDIVIITSREKNMTKVCQNEFGWPIELYIYNPEAFPFFFDRDVLTGNPFLPRMCAKSIVLKGEELGNKLKTNAIKVLEEGPGKWSESEQKHYRYLITDNLDDLIGSNNEAEELFIVNRLAELLYEFILRMNNQWTGEGKWLIRTLKAYDIEIYNQFYSAFDIFYKKRDKDKIIDFVRHILAPYGGELFEGYREG